MNDLLPPNPDKYKGCEMCFPDTIFFQKGVGKKLIKHDKDFCLTATTSTNKISQQNIVKEIQNVVRERMKDKNGEFKKLY